MTTSNQNIADRVKLYNSEYLDPDRDAESLQRKVQFDLRLHFLRRGSENMENMKKDHFQLEFNSQNETWRVVKKKDELTKNHTGIDELVSGVMPENPTDKMCPVRSYVLYTDHLNAENPFLWQLPLKVIDPESPNVWYGLQKLGKNTMAKFMSQLSIKCGLSQIYTNHCIRVTGASILTRMKFSASEIMSVTGHKSVQSLAVYQKTQDKTKEKMGHVLREAMHNTDDEIQKRALPAPQPQFALPPPPGRNLHPEAQAQQVFNANQNNTPFRPLPNKENVGAALIPFDANLDDQTVPSFDIGEILNDITRENNTQVSTTNNNTAINNVPKSMFSNCQIGSITFNVQPK